MKNYIGMILLILFLLTVGCLGIKYGEPMGVFFVFYAGMQWEWVKTSIKEDEKSNEN